MHRKNFFFSRIMLHYLGRSLCVCLCPIDSGRWIQINHGWILLLGLHQQGAIEYHSGCGLVLLDAVYIAVGQGQPMDAVLVLFCHLFLHLVSLGARHIVWNCQWGRDPIAVHDHWCNCRTWKCHCQSVVVWDSTISNFGQHGWQELERIQRAVGDRRPKN